jgi:hypothetical protein
MAKRPKRLIVVRFRESRGMRGKSTIAIATASEARWPACPAPHRRGPSPRLLQSPLDLLEHPGMAWLRDIAWPFQ